jgi:hypothetical protein
MQEEGSEWFHREAATLKKKLAYKEVIKDTLYQEGCRKL